MKFNFPKSGKITDVHPIQKLIYEDTHKFKIFNGGRYSGKSILLTASSLRRALSSEQQVCYIVCRTYNSAKKIFWKLLKEILQELEKRDGLAYKTNEHELSVTFENNSVIYLESADNADNLRGIRVDYFGVDEAASYNDPDFFDVAILPNLNPDGEVLVCSTPRGYNFFYDLYEEQNKNPELYKSWTFRTMDSPFPEVRQKAIEAQQKLSKALYEQEFEAKFVSSNNKAYNDFDRQIHTIDYPIQYDRPLCITTDYNYSWMCWTTFQIFTKEELLDKNITPPEGYYWQDEIMIFQRDFKTPNVNTQGQLLVLDKYLEEIEWHNPIDFYGDATRNRSVVSATDDTTWSIIQTFYPSANYYVPTSNSLQTNRVITVNNKLLNAKKEIGLLFNPEHCQETIKDFEQTIWMEGGKNIDKRREKHGVGHLQDAVGYAVYYLNNSSVYSNAECIIL